jgi:cytochrome c553
MYRIILIILTMVIVVVVAGVFTAEFYTAQPSFCGSCHIMKPFYDSWVKDKHSAKNITCVDCHYPPGEKHALKSKFKGLGQLFTYLGTGTNVVRAPAKVSDLSCTTSACHPNEKFMDKKVQYTEKIPYVHNTHQDKTIEGQALHCDTCHQHVRTENHFEVPKVISWKKAQNRQKNSYPTKHLKNQRLPVKAVITRLFRARATSRKKTASTVMNIQKKC